MPVETFDDILEELADMFGVYGAEARNVWVIRMRSRIEAAIAIEKYLLNERASLKATLERIPIIDDHIISEALADIERE